MESLSLYHFELPNHLIAQHPLEIRSDARLLTLRKNAAQPEHKVFKDIIELLNPGDLLVFNDTKVFPARLECRWQDTHGHAELLLVRKLSATRWLTLVQSKRRARPGQVLELLQKNGQISGATCTFLKSEPDEPGAFEIEFSQDAALITAELGKIPLPTYITREPDKADLARYQTVFANEQKPFSSAAPTAGFHFDEPLLEQLRQKGIETTFVTLNVGPGTFFPIRSDNLDEHQMHGEEWEISREAADAINRVKTRGGRIIAVGTTCVRTLESSAGLSAEGRVEAGRGLTRLFIRPGFEYKIVDVLVTNFHHPRTTLLLLVAAAIGRERLLTCYNEAIRHEYRFFSYGDSCYFEL